MFLYQYKKINKPSNFNGKHLLFINKLLMLFFLVCFSGCLYAENRDSSSSSEVTFSKAQSEVTKDSRVKPASKKANSYDLASINKMVDTLVKKMEKDPKNSDGWIMLGQSYDYLQQYAKAADAFAHAYQLLGDKPDVMLFYANSLSYANDQQVTGKAAQLVFKALALEPNNLNALWLGGMAKAQTGEFA